MNLSDTDTAYIAGLFDGEGCVGYYRRQQYHSASLHVCMTDPRPVMWLLDKVKCGRISISEKHDGRRKTVYSWQLGRKDQIRELLTAIRPHLKLKGDQVDILFHLWDFEADNISEDGGISNKVSQFREDVVTQMRLLKRA